MPDNERHRQARRLADAIEFDGYTVFDATQRHVPYTAELVGPLQLPRRPQPRTFVLTEPLDTLRVARGDERHAAPANAATATHDALDTAMTRLERTVRKLDPTAGNSPEGPDSRPSRDDDRRDTRTDHRPTIGM